MMVAKNCRYSRCAHYSQNWSRLVQKSCKQHANSTSETQPEACIEPYTTFTMLPDFRRRTSFSLTTFMSTYKVVFLKKIRNETPGSRLS